MLDNDIKLLEQPLLYAEIGNQFGASEVAEIGFQSGVLNDVVVNARSGSGPVFCSWGAACVVLETITEQLVADRLCPSSAFVSVSDRVEVIVERVNNIRICVTETSRQRRLFDAASHAMLCRVGLTGCHDGRTEEK